MKNGLIAILSLIIFFQISCNNKIDEIDLLIAEAITSDIEVGKNVRIIYSDSALVKIIVHAPVMERHTILNGNKDVFPKGIMIEFMDENKKVYSWLKADSAVREEMTSKIKAKGNVIFYNEKNEKLESPELIWDENLRIVYTEKLVRITQAEKGDTTYGFGFKANQDFTQFEIKKKVQGKINVSDFVNEIN